MRWPGIAVVSMVTACSGPGSTSVQRAGPSETSGSVEVCDPGLARRHAEALRDEGYLGRALIEAQIARTTCPADETAALAAALRESLGLDQVAKTPTAEEIAEALEMYRLGVRLRGANKLDDALVALRESYRLAPHPFTIVQIGRTHMAAGDPVEMRIAYARALALAERMQDAAAVPSVRQGHSSTPGVVEFSPDARLLVTADHGSVIVWDVATARQIRVLPGGRLGIAAAAFSPDGATLAIGTGTGTLRLVDTDTWKERELYAHRDGVFTIAFSPDSARVLTGGGDERIALYEVATFDLVFGLQSDHHIDQVAYSDDGTTIAVGGGNKITLRSANGDFLRSIEIARSSQREFAFSRDLSLAATGHRSYPVRLWNLSTGDLLHEISYDGLDVAEVELSPDGETLVIGDMDGTIRRWSTETGAQLEPMGSHAADIVAIAYSPGGAILATSAADLSIVLWDVAGRRAVHDLGRQSGDVNTVAFTRDGHTLVSGGRLGHVHVWDLTPTGTHRSHAVMSRVTTLDIDQKGERVVVGGDGTAVIMLDLKTGAELSTFQLDRGNSVAVRFGSRGQRVAAADSRGAFAMWSIQSGESLASGPTNSAGFVDLSPDLERCVGTYHGWVRVYLVATGELEREILLDDSAYGMGFGAGGKTLISTTGHGHVQLWNLETGDELRSFVVKHRERIEDAALSPDGTLVALGSSDETISLYDLELDELRATLHHDNDVNEVAFSPDGETLASASSDKTIGLWDTATGARLARLIATNDEWLVIADDGRIDGNDTDDGGPSFFYWQVGELQLPGFVGWQRAHAGGLLADLMTRPD